MSYALVAFALLFVVWFVHGSVRHKQLKKASESTFHRVYAAFHELPKLEISNSYGYPAFSVTFASKAVRQEAADAGLNEQFLQEIGQLCKGMGPRSSPFDANQAVFFTYRGWLEEEIAKAKRDQQS